MLALSYLLAWLLHRMEVAPSRPATIALHSTALCNVGFDAKACGQCYKQNH